MGGVPGSLLRLWCGSGCNTSEVQAALTYFPPEPQYAFERDGMGNLQLVMLANEHFEMPKTLQVHLLTTKRGSRVPVFFFRRPKAEVTIIYSHGNATDLGGMYHRYLSLFKGLYPQVNIIAYDYAGYGAAGGKPTEHGTYEDLETVYDWALREMLPAGPGRPRHRFVLYGQSVGSGPTIELASRRPVSGVVLHSAFLSGMRVVTSSRAISCLDIYPNVDRIGRIRCPVLVMHGMKDEEVSLAHGFELHKSIAPGFACTPWWVPDRGHNDIGIGDKHQLEYINRLQAFVYEVAKREPLDGLAVVR